MNVPNGILAHHGRKTYRAEYRSRPDEAREGSAAGGWTTPQFNG
jgi:hypothetical protein